MLKNRAKAIFTCKFAIYIPGLLPVNNPNLFISTFLHF